MRTGHWCASGRRHSSFASPVASANACEGVSDESAWESAERRSCTKRLYAESGIESFELEFAAVLYERGIATLSMTGCFSGVRDDRDERSLKQQT